MPDAEASIRKALELYLNSTPGVPALAWENVSFNPNIGTPFLKATLLFTSSRPAACGPSAQICHKGILKLQLYVPANSGPASSIATIIRNRFKQGTELNQDGFRIVVQYCERNKAPTGDGSWYMVPMDVSWFTYE